MKRLHGLSGKFAVVAALTCVTMFGTGYAAWNFSETASKEVSNAHAVTKRDPKGELTITKFGSTTITSTDFYLIIDQDKTDGLYFSTSNNVDNIDSTTNKEVCYASKFTTMTLNYVGSGATTQEEIKLDTKITCTQGATKSYTDYFEIKPTTASDTKSYSGVGANLEFTYTMPTVSWINGMKPLTKTAYDAMVTALTGASITFTFTASVVA